MSGAMARWPAVFGCAHGSVSLAHAGVLTWSKRQAIARKAPPQTLKSLQEKKVLAAQSRRRPRSLQPVARSLLPVGGGLSPVAWALPVAGGLALVCPTSLLQVVRVQRARSYAHALHAVA